MGLKQAPRAWYEKFNVSFCVKFQKEPKEIHLSAVKHIFRYLIGTPNLSLGFKREKGIQGSWLL